MPIHSFEVNQFVDGGFPDSCSAYRDENEESNHFVCVFDTSNK